MPKSFSPDAPWITNPRQAVEAPISAPSVRPISPTVSTGSISRAGELPVALEMVTLGRDEPGEMTRHVVAGPFAIAETEVSNERYREFVKKTGGKAPPDWQDQQYLPGTASYR